MKFVLSLILLLSVDVMAKPNFISMEMIETVTEDHATLRGVRWANPGKQRVLLVHGFSENTTIFQDLATRLHGMGYDVFAFNYRGHGNDNFRSLVQGQDTKKQTKSGVYSFDRIVTHDVPAMIDYVYNGKPIVTIGHSLGGSALRFFLSGIRDYGDGLVYTQDPKKLNKYITKIKTLINLGSPTSFQKSDLRFKAWTKLPEYLTNWALNPTTRKYLGEYLFAGLINMDNVRDSDRLFTDGFSLIPIDIIQDVQRWSDTVYSSRSGIQYEGLKVPSSVPFFQVVGGADNLVPLEEVVREQNEYKVTENPKIIVMRNFGHIDMTYDQPSAEILTPALDIIIKKKSIESLKQNKKFRVIEINSRFASRWTSQLTSLKCNQIF